MTLKIKRVCEQQGTRICLSGALRCPQLVAVLAEIEQAAQPTILDLDEVDIVDIEGVCLLNECEAEGIQVVNCSRYIREWMLQEKRISNGEK
jgi:ABC-type transporter Mla MlaB component